jgi:hypothetical protein
MNFMDELQRILGCMYFTSRYSQYLICELTVTRALTEQNLYRNKNRIVLWDLVMVAKNNFYKLHRCSYCSASEEQRLKLWTTEVVNQECKSVVLSGNWYSSYVSLYSTQFFQILQNGYWRRKLLLVQYLANIKLTTSTCDAIVSETKRQTCYV